MSQLVVYQFLIDLGGKATLKQIREMALRKFPESTLYSYVGQRLHKLEEEGVVKHNKKDDTWEIIPGKTFPSPPAAGDTR
jgi:cytochrome b involved in lipid metabolism